MGTGRWPESSDWYLGHDRHLTSLGWPIVPFPFSGYQEITPMSFMAKYDGLCLPCGEEIHKGEWLTTHPEYGFIHEECTDIEPAQATNIPRHGQPAPPELVLPRGKTTKDRCSECFQVPASNGECGCF